MAGKVLSSAEQDPTAQGGLGRAGVAAWGCAGDQGSQDDWEQPRAGGQHHGNGKVMRAGVQENPLHPQALARCSLVQVLVPWQ